MANAQQIKDGYRLTNDRFEAVIAHSGATIGIIQLTSRGEPAREKIEVRELPLTLRLGTDAPRIDIVAWDGHAGSGDPVPPENDWGYDLKLHEKPAGGASVQKLTDFPVGPPFYTDIYYP